MAGYRGSCPSCGAPVVFQLGTSLLRVCEHCGVALVRKGVDLAQYGRVAELIPTPSVLKLGIEGGYEGAPRFTLVGRLQLDYGAGTWDEWLMGFDNDSWAWLSESQGRFHYMASVAVPPLPRFSEIRVGQTIDAGEAGVFVASEVREARFMSAAGELPFDIEPGQLLRYVDLSGPGGQFGTIDYGTGDTVAALYVGREVTLDEIGIREIVPEEERLARVQAKNLSCPQCGGPIEIRQPDKAQRIACSYCGSLLDATRELAVLEATQAPGFKPDIPLGATGRLDDVTWTVIGAMERSVTVEGTRYPWREYLLYEATHGFRWLVEAKGHWSFVRPLNAGDVRGRATPFHAGTTYQHFQSGRATVDHVLGEFYWAVARGDQTKTDDYIAPPHMLSREEDEGREITWSHGTYKEPKEIEEAFGLAGRLPRRQGVGPHQPSPWTGRVGKLWAQAILASAAMFAVYLVLWFASFGRVFEQNVAVPQEAVSGSPEAAHFTEPFELKGSGNVQVRVRAPVNNSWLYVDGALINEDTGALDEFDVEVSYYYGSDSDGSWSEGGQSSTTYIGSVPPGRYILRLAPQWPPGTGAPAYEVSVRRRVPRFLYLLAAILVLYIWPGMAAWQASRFHIERWSESDHPVITSSED